MATSTDRKLRLEDNLDQRAYARERKAFTQHVIALKKRRRVGVGPFVTLLFENRDTIRFQIQEMARAEHIDTDEGIAAELDIYNPLIPMPGSLAATLFIELTSKDELMTWLPKLVGIERAVELRAGGQVIPCRPDPDHEKQLTREEITASVHYIHFDLTPEQVDAVARGPVELAITLDSYSHAAKLDEATVEELLADLKG
jgi:hypothetical protein